MEEFSQDTLERCMRKHFPDANELSFEAIHTGKFNTSYFVTTGNSELVLRIAPPPDSVFVFYERNMMRQEPGIHSLLLEKTGVPAAKIHAYDDSYETVDRDFLLMERLPGTALSDMSVLNQDTVLREVGRCLAETHALTVDEYGYTGPHRPMEPQKSWAPAFRIMWGKLVDDVVSVGYYGEEEKRHLLGLLEDHYSIFDRDIGSSLLHMDVWSQNILVDSAGNLTGLLDWDRALWGDPEIEFAVLDYCGISQPSFWQGYGKERDTSEEAQTRRIFYLLYELQKYIVIRHGRAQDPFNAQCYKRQVSELARSYFGSVL